MRHTVVPLHTAPENRASKPLPRLRMRTAKVTAVSLPDGRILYAQGLSREVMRNEQATAEDVIRMFVEMSNGGPFVVLGFAHGEVPKPLVLNPPIRRDAPFVDTTPCDV